MRTPNLADRLSMANAAKKAQLERAKHMAEDPERAQRLKARDEIAAARNRRITEREAARRAAREQEAAELAARQAAEAAAREAERKAREEAQARRLAEQTAREAAEAAEREAMLAARRAGRKKKKRTGLDCSRLRAPGSAPPALTTSIHLSIEVGALLPGDTRPGHKRILVEVVYSIRLGPTWVQGLLCSLAVRIRYRFMSRLSY